MKWIYYISFIVTLTLLGGWCKVYASGAIVQSCLNQNYANNTTTCTFGSNVTSGNTILAFTDQNTAAATTTVFGCGATWTLIDSNSSTYAFSAWKGTGYATGPCTVNVSWSTANNTEKINLLEVSGITGVLDTYASSTIFVPGSDVTGTTPTATTFSNGDFILSAWGHINPNASETSSPPFVLPFVNQTYESFLLPYYNQIVAGSISATMNNGSAYLYGTDAIDIFAFKTNQIASPPPISYIILVTDNW